MTGQVKGTKTFVLERNHTRNADNEVCLDGTSGAVLGPNIGGVSCLYGDDCTSQLYLRVL
jgi:hypothetical protein